MMWFADLYPAIVYIRIMSGKGAEMNIRNGYAITTIIFGFLLAGCATETHVDPLQPIDLGDLSFLAPSGEEWDYSRDDSDDTEFVLFRRGGSGSPAFVVMVWQARVDDPVNSEEDIWTSLLEPYKNAYNSPERNDEVNKTECNPDQTLTAMGLLCQVEGRLGFWTRTVDSQTSEVKGHVYAFVLPNDNREIGVIEYYQQVLPGVPPVDTRKSLDEFARNVSLLK
jgi:hypothetical protein